MNRRAVGALTSFSRLPTLRLLTYLVEFFKSDVVKPTHCWRYVLYR